MISRRTTAVLAGMLLAAGALRAQEAPVLPAVLTLEEAKRLALAGNPGVEALLARVQAAEALVRQARAALLPQVKASAGASWLRDVPLAQGNDNDVPLYQAGVQADWLLFDGFASRFRVEAAKAGTEVSLAEWHDGQRLLAEGVATAFLNGLLAAEAGRIAQRDADFNRELLAEAEKRVAAGAGARVDVLNFRVRVRTAENDLLGIQRERRSARQVLAALLGLPDGDLGEATELAASAAVARPLEAAAAIEVAFARRPDLQRYQHAIAQLDATVRSRRGEFLPRLALQGGYALDRVDDPRFDRERDAASFIGLGLSWELYAGGRRAGAVAEAEAQRLALAHLRNRLRLDIAAEVRQAVDAVTTTTEQLANQREIAEMAREIREIVRKEYLSGVSTLTRLNEVQTDVVRAEGRLAQIDIRRAQAMETLAAACGENLPSPGGAE